MSIASIFKVPEPAASPAARWTLAGRVAAAGTLVLGAGFELAANSIGPQAASTTLDEVRWAAEHTGSANLTFVFALLAVPFLVGSAFVYVLLARQRSPRLAYTGGILLGFGLVSLSAVEGYQTLMVALVEDPRFDLTVLAEVVDQVSSPAVIAMYLLFIPFAFFGLLISAAALWRSRAVPRGAVLLIPAFVIVDFFLREGFGSVPEFAGPAISFVAACWISSSVLRTEHSARNELPRRGSVGQREAP